MMSQSTASSTAAAARLDLQLARVTGEGVVRNLGIIYRGIPDAQRPVDLNTTAVVLLVAAEALSFTVAANKAMPRI
jgi:hypothetical protein